MRNSLFLLLFVFVLCSSCENESDTEEKATVEEAQMVDPLIKANKHMVDVEEEAIDNLVKRYNWDVIESGTGLRYMIYEKGNGQKSANGLIARIAYSIKLINGTLLYSSETDGEKEFLIGKDEVESGLHEGILFMRGGDKAKFILPSHLAFGLIGDQNKIPARATLIYDVELLELKTKK